MTYVEDDDTNNNNNNVNQTGYEATQNLFKSFVGAGILALPAGFLSTGILLGTIALICLGMLSLYCVRLLLTCVHRINKSGTYYGQNEIDDDERKDLIKKKENTKSVETFDDVGYVAYGENGRKIANLVLLSAQIGFCTAYVSFISFNMSDIIPFISRSMWILLLTPGLCLLCMVRHFKYIAPWSAVGNVLFSLSIFFFLIAGFTKYCCIPKNEVIMVRPIGLFSLFGTAAFALEGMGTIIPVERRMIDRSSFSSILNGVMIGITILYTVFGVMGYLFFGGKTESVITINLGKSIWANLVKINLCLCLLVSYAINMFPVSEVFDIYMAQRLDVTVLLSASPFGPAVDVKHRSVTRHCSLGPSSFHLESESDRKLRQYWLYTSLGRIVMVCCTAFVAWAIPDFGSIVSLMGSLTNGLLAFILPALFYLKICKPSTGLNFRFAVLPVFVVIFGTIASISGVVWTLNDIAKHHKTPIQF